MKKNVFKNIISVFLVAVMLIAGFAAAPTEADAATSVAISGTGTFTVGDTVKLTFKYSGKNLYSVKSTLSFDSSVLTYKSTTATTNFGSGGSYTFIYESLDGAGNPKGVSSITYTVTFTAKKAGTITLKNTLAEVCDAEGNDSEPGTVTQAKVTVKNYEASTDNYLTSLTVSPGTLTPKFDKEVTEYHITVDSSVTQIVVSAKKSDSKAKVTGAGKISLADTNNVTITVTAESGDERTYTIIVGELDPLQISAGGSVHDISQTISDDLIPEGFSKTDLSRGGKSFEGIVSNYSSDIVLAYLTADGVGTWYYYDTANETFSDSNGLSPDELFVYTKAVTDSQKEADQQNTKANAGSVSSILLILIAATLGILLVVVIVLQVKIIQAKKT